MRIEISLSVASVLSCTAMQEGKEMEESVNKKMHVYRATVLYIYFIVHSFLETVYIIIMSCI